MNTKQRKTRHGHGAELTNSFKPISMRDYCFSIENARTWHVLRERFSVLFLWDKPLLRTYDWFIGCLRNPVLFIVYRRHIIVAGKTEVFGNWESDWFCGFDELTSDPTTDKNKLILTVPVSTLDNYHACTS